MVFRLTRGIAMGSAGVVIVVVLIIAGAMLFNSMLATATQAHLAGSVVLSSSSQGPELEISYLNQGNRPVSLPPLVVPLVLVGGFPFTVGRSGTGGSITPGSGGISVAPPTAPSPECAPGLSLSSPAPGGYLIVSGVSPIGPSTVTAVFAGTSSWPARGLGLMLAAGFSDLFVLETAGNGSTTATVAYDNYSVGARGIVGQFARSSPFAFDTLVSSTFTISLSGLGAFVLSVDGTPRLNGSMENFLPRASPLAVWATNQSFVGGLVASVGDTTLWEGPTAVCGTQLVVPLSASELPEVVSNTTPSEVVGPISGVPAAPGPFYVLEVFAFGPSATSAVRVASCSTVLLGVNATLAITAPWVD